MKWYGYVVSEGGTFGVSVRTYVSSMTGEDYLVIEWGPLGWITPVLSSECRQLSSSYEGEAWVEAQAWLESRCP